LHQISNFLRGSAWIMLGSLQRSPRLSSWWGGGSLSRCPLPKNPTPALGLRKLRPPPCVRGKISPRQNKFGLTPLPGTCVWLVYIVHASKGQYLKNYRKDRRFCLLLGAYRKVAGQNRLVTSRDPNMTRPDKIRNSELDERRR